MPALKKSTIFSTLTVVLALALAAVLFGNELWELFSSQEKIEAAVENAGAWGPLLFIFLQSFQVLVAPIPGQITSFAAGFLFGTVLGSIYSIIGLTIGITLVIYLSRRLGRPFVERFVDKKNLKKFDYLADTKGLFAFFLMALLPFFPDDLICFVAGLTKLPVRTLVFVTVLGRVPGAFVFALAGQGVADSRTNLVVYLVALAVVLSALAWWRRDDLERLARSMSRRPKNK